MTLPDLLFPQLILAVFNLVNVRIDAYRIMKNKTIAHWLNFGLYFFWTAALDIIWHIYDWRIALFAIAAFCCRQWTFDMPLSLRRGKKWNYVSEDPKAALDRIEIKVFGHNGTNPMIFYAIMWITSLLIMYWI